jgi:hypothetical protein
MTKLRLLVFILTGSLFCSLPIPVQAQAGIQLVSDHAALSFSESATFQAEFKSGVNITSVVLEYGVDQLTCGTVVGKAFPQFTAATSVQVEWTWQMRESGSLPPGATLWWVWQVQDTSGAQFTSSKQTIIWLDGAHNWQVISGGNINLHYYEGGQTFGQTLHDTAAQALVRLSKDVGLNPEKPVDIYIYASTDDLKDAILYEPSWIGGEAFPENNIVIIGISTDQLEWGKGAEAHELTHVLVGHLTFSCLGSIPTWLNEGLAMYGEGGPQSAQVTQFEQARTSDQLPSLRSLTGEFSEESDRANLSYTVSYSVVNFLIQGYGRDKMTSLLIALRDGETVDDALQAVYGFNMDGLEVAWRSSVNAVPHAGTSNPTSVPTATQVPTLIPVGAITVTPAAPTSPPVPAATTSTVIAPTQEMVATGTPLSGLLSTNHNMILAVGFGLFCCILVALFIVLLVLFVTRLRSRRQK